MLDHPLRVILQQPALPAYRVPVFRALARRPGIDLKVIHGKARGITNIEPDGFTAEYAPMRSLRVGRRTLWWHVPQWQSATPRRCDVLVLSWNLHYASLVPALLRARANGVRTVLWGHGYSKREARWRRWPRERVARLADALLFYNHTAAQQYLDARWDAKRIFVAPNAIDQGPIQAARQHWLDRPDELAAFRREHGLDHGPILLFVSRLEPTNRLDLLVEAAARLAPDFPTLQCVIIGKGEAERDRLLGLAQQHNVADRFRFLGPIYDELQLAPWFLAADVFCYPANIGLSILHAFGYGLPVVTSDDLASQNPEIETFRSGENGLFYKHDDSTALPQALRYIFASTSKREQMSDAALRTATQRVTLQHMVHGMENAVRGQPGHPAMPFSTTTH